MNITFQIFILTIFISSLSFSQNRITDNDDYKYFNENYNSISKIEYENGNTDF
jgi:hypothetical protein